MKKFIIFILFIIPSFTFSEETLIEASINGQTKMVKTLIKAGANVNAADKYGNTALFYAVINFKTNKMEAQTDMIKTLIDAGADVNFTDIYGEPLLMHAVQNCQKEAVKELIAAKADVNAKDKNGYTALIDAAAYNGVQKNIDIVKALIAAKPDINAANNDGDTALIIASTDGKASIHTGRNKIRIAVFDLESKSKELSKDEVETLSDYIRSVLIKTGVFTVISRDELGKTLEEYKLQVSGITEESNAIQIGKIMNVRDTIVGTIGKFGNSYIVNIKMLDLETGRYFSAESIKAETKEEALKQINQKVDALANDAGQ
jgi:TolB-like protein